MKRAFVSIVGSGALAQLLLVVSTPWLTRLHDERAFGAFGVATTVALIGSTLLSLRLEHATHVSRLGPNTIYRSALTTIVLFSLPVAALVAIASSMIASRSGAIGTGVSGTGGSDLVWILGFAIGHATHAVGLMLLNYRRRFRTIAAIVLLVPGVFLVGALAIPSPPLDGNALLIWQCVAYACGAVATLYVTRDALFAACPDTSMSAPERRPRASYTGVSSRNAKPTTRTTNERQLLRMWFATLRRERDSWRFLVPSQLLSIGALNIAVVGAALVFDPATAGLILIAQRIARTPVTMLGNTLNEVLRSTIPDRQALQRTFRMIASAAVLIAAAMIVTVQLVPYSAYALLLGDGWSDLGPVLTITVFGAAAQLVGSSVASLLTALDRRSDFIVNAALATVGAVSLWFAARLDVAATTWLWWQVLGSACVYVCAFALAVRTLRNV